MQCDYCQNKATVFFTQIVDGKTIKLSLCDNCATEKGVTDPEGFLIGNIKPIHDKEKGAESLMPEETLTPDDILTEEPHTSTLTCSNCGFTFEDLKKTGRLGCSHCYNVFREYLQHNLAGMHKGIHHKGRVPKGMMEAFQQQQVIETIKQEMNEAITAEDYEKAATLRDQLRDLSQ